LALVAVGLALLVGGLAVAAPPEQTTSFSFFVAGDMRKYAGVGYRDPGYFLTALDAMRSVGPGAFIILPGDLDPATAFAREAVTSTLGAACAFYPVIGNHDAESPGTMTYIRGLNAGGTKLPNVVRRGPPRCEETMYAFDWSDAHVVVLNEYFDGKSDTGADGDVTDATFAWLGEDLSSTTKPFIFVVGHVPAHVFPDMTSGRMRHEGGGLEVNPAHRDRFWKLLKDRHVTAYFCGHSHNASAKKIDGVWQLDSGAARGKGDTGAPSTFIKITVGDRDCRYEYYRADANGLNYKVALAGSLVKD
jgi:hypothetical protein